MRCKSHVSQQIKGLYRSSHLYAITNFYDEPIYGLFPWLQLKVYAVHFLNSMFLYIFTKLSLSLAFFNCWFSVLKLLKLLHKKLLLYALHLCQYILGTFLYLVLYRCVFYSHWINLKLALVVNFLLPDKQVLQSSNLMRSSIFIILSFLNTGSVCWLFGIFIMDLTQ